jgi:hypothetical protein
MSSPPSGGPLEGEFSKVNSRAFRTLFTFNFYSRPLFSKASDHSFGRLAVHVLPDNADLPMPRAGHTTAVNSTLQLPSVDATGFT